MMTQIVKSQIEKNYDFSQEKAVMENKDISLFLSPFSEILKIFRKRRGLRQQELAEQLGIHRNTIGGWERGDMLPDSKTMMIELAHKLHLDEQETHLLLEASLTAIYPYWHVPYQRNPFFTGREAILKTLHQALSHKHTTVLTQSYALCGLGGIGKTMTALEYAYQHAFDYTAVLWISADTYENIITSFVSIAELLHLSPYCENSQNQIVTAVIRWLNTHKDWLLIFDNVEDLEMAKEFFPRSPCGSLLLTTPMQSLNGIAQSIEMPPMTIEEGVHFLLRRAKYPDSKETVAQVTAPTSTIVRNIVECVDGLPLALDHIGAYIDETQCSFSEYFNLFQTHKTYLLGKSGTHRAHPDSVIRTFTLSIEKIAQQNSIAIDLLRLFAFLAPDTISEEMITKSMPLLSPGLRLTAVSPLQFNEVLKILLTYSFIQRNQRTGTLTIHRLVQLVVKHSMDETEQRQWAEYAVKVVNHVFPNGEDTTTWPQCELYLSHALVCTTSITNWSISSPEGQRLLQQTGVFLREQGKYSKAEALLREALNIRRQVLGEMHPEVAAVLRNFAQLYMKQGKYSQAEPLLQQAYAICHSNEETSRGQKVLILGALAELYISQSHCERAQTLLRRAFKIGKQIFEEKHPEVATLMSYRAMLHIHQHEYAQAQTLYEQALAIYEHILGHEHPHVAKTLHNLAKLYEDQAQFVEAILCYQRALKIRERILGSEHPDTRMTSESYLSSLTQVI